VLNVTNQSRPSSRSRLELACVLVKPKKKWGCSVDRVRDHPLFRASRIQSVDQCPCILVQRAHIRRHDLSAVMAEQVGNSQRRSVARICPGCECRTEIIDMAIANPAFLTAVRHAVRPWNLEDTDAPRLRVE
jgi:hypothetical protein